MLWAAVGADPEPRTRVRASDVQITWLGVGGMVVPQPQLLSSSSVVSTSQSPSSSRKGSPGDPMTATLLTAGFQVGASLLTVFVVLVASSHVCTVCAPPRNLPQILLSRNRWILDPPAVSHVFSSSPQLLRALHTQCVPGLGPPPPLGHLCDIWALSCGPVPIP